MRGMRSRAGRRVDVHVGGPAAAASGPFVVLFGQDGADEEFLGENVEYAVELGVHASG